MGQARKHKLSPEDSYSASVIEDAPYVLNDVSGVQKADMIRQNPEKMAKWKSC